MASENGSNNANPFVEYVMTIKQKFWTARIIMGIAVIYVLSLGLPSTHHEYDLQRTIGFICMTSAMVVMVYYSKKMRKSPKADV